MGGLYFEDVEVGDSYTAGPYSVTKSEIIRFAQQYDPVPEKIDEEAAARSILGG
jgi:acyl dehydratase